jgi:GAF domain-containing protein/anti-sigma regulatory factor (Ser/Thr protein kinase)
VCGAADALIFHVEGGALHRVAQFGSLAVNVPTLRPISRETPPGRAILERRTIHIEDIVPLLETEYPLVREAAIAVGARTHLAAPLIREGVPIGAILIRRTTVQPFTDRQMELLETFAAQAVIAIENVRLFTELQERNRALTDTIEQQTATSEILKVISSSPTDTQPVFDTIIRNAVRLSGAVWGAVTRIEGELIHLVAHHNLDTEVLARLRRIWPHPVAAQSPTPRVVRTGQIFRAADVEAEDCGLSGEALADFRARGIRSMLVVPMVRDGRVVGTINLTHQAVGAFSDAHVALITTFADQAVIAIENVRLFKELESKNGDLTTALEQQTATSEILRVISSSPTDVAPVFQTILSSTNRLCEASFAVLWLWDGEALVPAAHANVSPGLAERLRTSRARPRRGGSPVALTALEQAVIHVPDVLDDPRFSPADVPSYQLEGARSILAVPMLREGSLVGVINTWRLEPRAFTDKQVELLKTFADQAVIAIENVRLFTELQEKNRALAEAHKQATEALEQQTATSEILKVISSSPTNVQPVLDAVAENAARLCGADDAVIQRVDSGALKFAAHFGSIPTPPEHALMPITREMAVGSAVLDRRTVHVHDMAEELRRGNYPASRPFRDRDPYRTLLCVPLVQEDVAVGVIVMRRAQVQPFTDKQIALVKTFADQAVIAIENARLFRELEARNRELTEALEQQTATEEILRVIGRSPTDAQPVFEAIARSAVSVCEALGSGVFIVEGGMLQVVATHGVRPERVERFRTEYPLPLNAKHDAAETIRSGRTFHMNDIEHNPNASAEQIDFARLGGYRTRLMVPMVRGDTVLGLIAVTREDPTPFPERRVELLQTFADQAVIAIENVRLFNETKEALERQTATADILRVISAAHTEAQPVFDTIVQSAGRLCRAASAAVFLTDGRMLYEPANYGGSPERLAAARARYPRPLDMDTTGGIAVLTRSVVHVPDTEDPSAIEWIRQSGRLVGFRSVVTVPMLREGDAVGAILVTRRDPGPFSDTEVELLKTFTDQAVIAIENVRLFRELQTRTGELTRSVNELKALGEVGQAISSTLDLQTVLRTIVARATQLAEVDAGVIYEYDEQGEVFVPRATERLEAEIVDTLIAAPVRRGEGVTGRLADSQEPIQLSDILEAPAEGRVRDTLGRAGYRALLAVPLVREDHLLGGLTVFRKTPGEFSPEVIELLRTFATQSALAIQNARLFHEIEDKSRQLEIASQHKSEFLANMSHELRTPLNAIIGFSEVLDERLFGELNEKQAEYLKDIHASGQHLLSLINDILDLSKIEAGRMELELTDFDLPTAIDNALTLVRERAGRRGIALHHAVHERLGQVRGDERKIKQVLLNLLSNAIKFTPDGGRIDVRARPVDGSVEVSVSDTGVGIAPEDLEAIFEEFRQVGTDDKKVEGTGLGLALSRKFIELHGGKISVESQVGTGSTFTFKVPARRGE